MDRFLAKIEPEPNSGCWIWIGAGLKYGNFKYDGRVIQAQRAAWLLFIGGIPAGFYVCHRCDVARCVNPQHLFIGTIWDNATDAKNKGRTARGERNWNARLTAADIVRIRGLAAAGVCQREIMNTFGIVQSAVSNIIHRRRWGHVV